MSFDEELHPRRAARARRVAERRIASRDHSKPAAGAPRAVRESFSMNLLEELWNRTPEPDYEILAATRRPMSTRAKVFAGALAVVLGFTGALSTVNLLTAGPQTESSREYLLRQIADGTKENEELADSNAAKSKEQDELRRSALGEDDVEADTRLAEAAAVEPLSGHALIVTMTDQRSGPADANPRAEQNGDNTVHDVDLQTVVNYLFASGAQGVAVNNHRLSATSAIRAAGQAILVNYDPLVPPYEIVAIGPKDMKRRLAATPGADYLGMLWQDYGISTDITEGKREIPGADLHKPEYARILEPEGTS